MRKRSTPIRRILFGAALALAMSFMAGAEPQNETAATAAKSRSETEVSQSAAEPSKKESQGAVESSQEERTTWRDNPNDCDLDTQYVRKDNLECIDKPSASQRTENTNLGAPQRTAGCEQYRGLVSQYDWNTDVAMAVMEAESGCNPDAVNWRDNHGQCTGSFGLFQLACFHTANPRNPSENVREAYRIWTEQGWYPWGAYTNGSYMEHL